MQVNEKSDLGKLKSGFEPIYLSESDFSFT
jgi:hypothetical protein